MPLDNTGTVCEVFLSNIQKSTNRLTLLDPGGANLRRGNLKNISYPVISTQICFLVSFAIFS